MIIRVSPARSTPQVSSQAPHTWLQAHIDAFLMRSCVSASHKRSGLGCLCCLWPKPEMPCPGQTQRTDTCGRKGSQTELTIQQHEILELKGCLISTSFVTLQLRKLRSRKENLSMMVHKDNADLLTCSSFLAISVPQAGYTTKELRELIKHSFLGPTPDSLIWNICSRSGSFAKYMIIFQ